MHLKGRSVIGLLVLLLEWFTLFKSRKVIGIILHELRYIIGLRTRTPIFIQSELETKPSMTRSHSMSRALRRLFTMTLRPGSYVAFLPCRI